MSESKEFTIVVPGDIARGALLEVLLGAIHDGSWFNHVRLRGDERRMAISAESRAALVEEREAIQKDIDNLDIILGASPATLKRVMESHEARDGE